jgi:hypothetical protein
MIQILILALSIGNAIQDRGHDPRSNTAGSAFPARLLLDGLHVGPDHIDDINPRVPDSNSVPPDESFYLFLFVKLQREVKPRSGFSLRFRLSPMIGNHSPPTAKKDICHTNLATRQCKLQNEKLALQNFFSYLSSQIDQSVVCNVLFKFKDQCELL